MNTAVVALNRLFAWKIRGIRWVEIIGLVLVAAMIFSVYLAKAAAADESAKVIRRPEITSRAPARKTLSRRRRRLQPVPVAFAMARRAMCMT